MPLSETIAICIQRLVVFIGVEVLIVYNNYTQQRALITQVIKTHMTQKQQALLRDYFEKSQDPVFVIFGTLILFVNKSAKALFKTGNIAQLESSSKLFRVYEESLDFVSSG